MTRDDALELIERMPYIPAFVIHNDKNRIGAFKAALTSDDPVEWIKIIKTVYICRNDKKAGRQPGDAETAIEQKAKEQLQRLLAPALGLEPDRLDPYIEKHLSEMW